MTSRPTLNEQLDACRPGTNDLNSPDCAELRSRLAVDPQLQASRSQLTRLDSHLRDVFQNVPVPTGLAERLLAAVQSATPSETADAGGVREPAMPAAAATVSASLPGNLPAVRTASRRWIVSGIASSLALLMVAALMGTWLGWFGSHRPCSPELLAAETPAWVGGLGDQWQVTVAPRNRPVSARLRKSTNGWQRLTTSWDASAAAFCFPQQRGRAFLFVLKPGSNGSIPNALTRLPMTGIWDAGAWTEGKSLYVLVVEKRGGARLEDYVAPGPTLARHVFKNEGHSASLTINPA